MAYDKPIIIQVQDPDTEAWTDKYRLHACVNKSNGNTDMAAGADQYHADLIFKVRYFSELEALRYSPQPFRILYRDRAFKIIDWDDFMEQHREITIRGRYYVV